MNSTGLVLLPNLFSMRGFVFTLFLLLVSCSSDDGPKPGCFQESNRKIVAEIKEAAGTIRGSQCDGKTFVIEPDEKLANNPLRLFFPCNLTETFQKGGAKVIFSGYVYESFDTEDICADFFEITEMRPNE